MFQISSQTEEKEQRLQTSSQLSKYLASTRFEELQNTKIEIRGQIKSLKRYGGGGSLLQQHHRTPIIGGKVSVLRNSQVAFELKKVNPSLVRRSNKDGIFRIASKSVRREKKSKSTTEPPMRTRQISLLKFPPSKYLFSGFKRIPPNKKLPRYLSQFSCELKQQGLMSISNQVLASHILTFTDKQKRRLSDKPTLILDMDETLIHCKYYGYEILEEEIDSNDQGIPVTFEAEGKPMRVRCYLRPHVEYFLKEISQHYGVILFTAATRDYGKAVSKLLDPKKEVFAKFLFREACIRSKIGVSSIL